MPKRKHHDDEYEVIRKKIREIEKKLSSEKAVKKHRRVRVISSSSDSSQSSSEQQQLENYDCDVRNRTENSVAHADSDLLEAATTTALVHSQPPPPEDAEPLQASPKPAPGDVPAALEPQLDDEILEILGVDPTNTITYGDQIQKDLAIRLEHGATAGLTKESRKELIEKHLVPINCKLVGAPLLNPEIKAALPEQVVKRDKAIETKQKVLSAAISSLGRATSLVLSAKEKDTNMLRLLMDTGRLLCDCQHSDTLTRRNYVTTSIKKDMKESLQNTKVDSLLFGENLPDTLKASKAINKSGAELKINPLPKAGPSKRTTPSTSKNWKSNLARKPATTAVTTTKESTASVTSRNQRSGYSKSSQSQRGSRSRR